jgi:PAS domain S-box-containing protein
MLTLAAPILLIGVCAIGLALITNHLLQVMRMDRHSVEVIDAGHELEKLIIDMETGLRGFKMTGDSRFLEPYNLAEPQIDIKFSNLGRLVADNPAQTDALNAVQKSVRQWRDWAGGSIRAGKYDTEPGALDMALSRKAQMDSIRSQLATFLGNEELILKARSSEVDLTKQGVFAFEILALGLVAILTGLHVGRQMHKLADSYEDSLRDVATQKEWFRVTLSSIGDAVIVTDVNGQTTFMNAEAERMTGWQWGEARGKALRSIFRIVNEETRRSVDDPVEKVFKEKRVVGLANHTLLLSKSGVEWPIEDSAAPIYDPDQTMVGVVLVFHDATEMRRAEKILKTHAQDLEQKVLARTVELQRTINELEAFSYTVSHDLRAPLRAMQGYSNALLEDFADKWGTEERDFLTRISKAAERLDILIQDLLTYSKVSKDHQAIVPVNLNRLAQDILTQYPTFQNPTLKFEVRRPLEPVLGHESGLTQVISNLLTNAVKFTDPARPPKIKIWTDAKEFTVRLWIEDNGIGIDPENHSRIFKMFEQVDGKKYDGTGIGLAIAKKAVENMQGSIGLESSLGSGTKMWIELLRAKNV